METQAVQHGGRWIGAAAAALAVAILGAPFMSVLAAGNPRHLVLPLLAPVSAALVLVAAALSGFQWYVGRSPAAPWVAAAFALLSIRIVVRFVFPLAGGVGEIERAVGCACMIASVVLIGCGAARRYGYPAVRVVATAASTAVVLGVFEYLAHREVANLDSIETALPLVTWCAVALLSARCIRVDRSAYTFGALTLVGLAVPLYMAANAVHDSLGFETADHQGLGLLFVVSVIIVVAAAGDVRQTLSSQRAELDLHRTQSMLIGEMAQRERELAQERAHEAGSALVAIEGAVRILERHYGALPEDTRRELSGGVYAEIRRLQMLVDTESPQEDPTALDMAEVIGLAVTAARTHGLKVVVDVEPGLVALGERVGTTAAIENLLVNVHRHAEGSDAVVRAWRDRDRVVVEVSDSGPGVSPSDVARIFERGMRGTTSASVPGQGLGLFVARRTVRRHGGDLSYRDRPGGGAVFCVELEVAEPKQNPIRFIAHGASHRERAHS